MHKFLLPILIFILILVIGLIVYSNYKEEKKEKKEKKECINPLKMRDRCNIPCGPCDCC